MKVKHNLRSAAETKFTPGPWRFFKSSVIRAEHPSGEYELDIVLIDPLYQLTGEERQMAEANARLIAAAPDLLEACISAFELMDWLSSDILRPYDAEYFLRKTTEKAQEHKRRLSAVIAKAMAGGGNE